MGFLPSLAAVSGLGLLLAHQFESLIVFRAGHEVFDRKVLSVVVVITVRERFEVAKARPQDDRGDLERHRGRGDDRKDEADEANRGCGDEHSENASR